MQQWDMLRGSSGLLPDFWLFEQGSIGLTQSCGELKNKRNSSPLASTEATLYLPSSQLPLLFVLRR
jgi:hypothetical protein